MVVFMFYKFRNMIKRFIFSAVLIYAYDSFNIFSIGIIPINFINIGIVIIFGLPGLLFLIIFSFII